MKILKFYIALIVCLVTVACGGGQQKQATHSFAGSFVDEFSNKFTLLDDHRAIIQFAGNDFADTTTWDDGGIRNWGYATIAYNGNPAHFYLKDGYLYRHQNHMEKGYAGIKITYSD